MMQIHLCVSEIDHWAASFVGACVCWKH